MALSSQVRVVNLHVEPHLAPGTIYVGRPCPQYSARVNYGNTVHINRGRSRAEALREHWQIVHSTPGMVDSIRRDLAGKNLACFCHPQPCHADTLIRVANATPEISEFRGIYDFLSNFYPATIRSKSGIVYPTSEHAYQAMKTRDKDARRHIASLPTPGDAKREGRRLSLRADWEARKLSIMRRIVRAKFRQHEELGRALIDTRGATLIEGNWWHDTYWGVCNSKGHNYLGRILMALRQELLVGYGFV